MFPISMLNAALTAAVVCLLLSLVRSEKSPLGPKTLLQELTFEFLNGPHDGANR